MSTALPPACVIRPGTLEMFWRQADAGDEAAGARAEQVARACEEAINQQRRCIGCLRRFGVLQPASVVAVIQNDGVALACACPSCTRNKSNAYLERAAAKRLVAADKVAEVP